MTDPLGAFRAAFRFQYQHEVEFREIDMLGHVNNVRYCEWAETVRCRYFDDVIGKNIGGEQGVILAKHDLRYENIVLYREHVLIGGRVSRWGGKSFDFETEVWSLPQTRRVFRSTAVLVAYDYTANHSIAIPAAWRDRVTAYG